MRSLAKLFARLRKTEGDAGGGLVIGMPPQYIDVPLGRGASLSCRPATSLEVQVASARAARFLTGLMVASDARETAAAILGEEFSRSDIDDEVWRVEVANRFAILELAVLCVRSWQGIRGPDMVSIDRPDRASLALLFQDPESKTRVESVINSRLHEEAAEGNGSAASLNGEAAIPDIAQSAGLATIPAVEAKKE